MRPDDYEWPQWEDYGPQLEQGLTPLFKRHTRDLIDLLQRPKWDGGYGYSKADAQDYYYFRCAALWDTVYKLTYLVHQQIDPNVFFMHVCNEIYLDLKSKLSNNTTLTAYPGYQAKAISRYFKIFTKYG